jgi:hypothetical protein
MTGWDELTVAELQESGVLLVEDGNHGNYRPRPDEYEEVGIPFIRATDIADGRLLFDSAPKINAVARRVSERASDSQAMSSSATKAQSANLLSRQTTRRPTFARRSGMLL